MYPAVNESKSRTQRANTVVGEEQTHNKNKGASALRNYGNANIKIMNEEKSSSRLDEHYPPRKIISSIK